MVADLPAVSASYSSLVELVGPELEWLVRAFAEYSVEGGSQEEGSGEEYEEES